MARSVLVALHQLPPGAGNLADVLRTAVGLSAAYAGHTVAVVLFGEGVLCALKGRNSGWVDRYVKAARAHKVDILAESASLDDHGLKADDLAAAIQPITAQEYLDRWRQSDVHLRV